MAATLGALLAVGALYASVRYVVGDWLKSSVLVGCVRERGRRRGSGALPHRLSPWRSRPRPRWSRSGSTRAHDAAEPLLRGRSRRCLPWPCAPGWVVVDRVRCGTHRGAFTRTRITTTTSRRQTRRRSGSRTSSTRSRAIWKTPTPPLVEHQCEDHDARGQAANAAEGVEDATERYNAAKVQQKIVADKLKAAIAQDKDITAQIAADNERIDELKITLGRARARAVHG